MGEQVGATGHVAYGEKSGAVGRAQALGFTLFDRRVDR